MRTFTCSTAARFSLLQQPVLVSAASWPHLSHFPHLTHLQSGCTMPGCTRTHLHAHKYSNCRPAAALFSSLPLDFCFAFYLWHATIAVALHCNKIVIINLIDLCILFHWINFFYNFLYCWNILIRSRKFSKILRSFHILLLRDFFIK